MHFVLNFAPWVHLCYPYLVRGTWLILIWALWNPIWPTLSSHPTNPLVYAVCPSAVTLCALACALVPMSCCLAAPSPHPSQCSIWLCAPLTLWCMLCALACPVVAAPFPMLLLRSKPFPMLLMPQYGFLLHSPPHTPYTCHFCYTGRIIESQILHPKTIKDTQKNLKAQYKQFCL